MEAYKIELKLKRAILKQKFEIVIIFPPPKGNHEEIEIFMSLSDINYNKIRIEEEGRVVKLSDERKVPFPDKISSIKCL